MRDNPNLDEEAAITELGVGEALVSCLDEKGRPNIVERALIVPPHAQIGPITPDERKQVIASSLLAGHYEKMVDRESAYELLKGRTDEKQPAATEQSAPSGEAAPAASNSGGGILGGIGGMLGGVFGGGGTSTRASNRQGMGEAFAKSAVRSIGSAVGREIIRGVLGSIFKR
jgi:DNA helicase HerA-like ATPase